MKAKVDEELDRLLKELIIITPVKYSDWAAPVVPILKPVGSQATWRLHTNSERSVRT